LNKFLITRCVLLAKMFITRTFYNLIKYKTFIPYRAKIYIDPKIDKIYWGRGYGFSPIMDSSKIIRNWPISKKVEFVSHSYKFQRCYKHFVLGLNWIESGVNDFSEIEVRNRYKNLDYIYEKIKTDHRFSKKFSPWVGIGIDKSIYFLAGGNHRISISIITGIPFKAYVGWINLESKSYYHELRRRKKTKRNV